jgi:membrane-bound lytic murein transglycosylase B
MRFSSRLLLIGCVAACAPMLPEPPLPAIPTSQPAPAPATTPPAPAPTPSTNPPLAAYDQQGFEGWKQSFLARASSARRAAYAREMEGLTPDPSVVRLDRNQPEFSRPAGVYVQNAATAVRIAQAKQRIDRVPWAVVQRFGVPSEILVGIWAQESAFGQVQGDYDVIRSLATLAYDGRRRAWAAFHAGYGMQAKDAKLDDLLGKAAAAPAAPMSDDAMAQNIRRWGIALRRNPQTERHSDGE